MLRVRNEAKTNVRRFVDDVSFVVSKESRDRLKGDPAPAARPLPRHRQPDHPLAERVAAGHARRGEDGGERAQHPGPRTRASAQHPAAGHRARRNLAPRPEAPSHPCQVTPPAVACRLKLVSRHEHERSSARDPWRHHPGLPGRSGLPRSAPTCTTSWTGSAAGSISRSASRWPGTLKAGKSTLVNALVGEDIAPTDATEATRIVTWFRNGPTPKVTANHRGGRRSNVPIARDAGDQRRPDVRLRQPRPRRRRRPRRRVARRRTGRHHDHRHPGHVVAVARRLRADAAAAGPRGRRAARRRRGVPAAHAQRRRHRAAQADRHARRRLGGCARRHRGGVAGRRDRRRPHRRDAVGQGRRHPVHRRDGQDRHLPGRRPGVRAAGADRAHAAAERVRRAGEARRRRRRRAGQGDAVGGPVRPRGQRAARRRRHPRGAAGPVRHVRHPDLDRGAARRVSATRWRWPTNCSSAAG